VTRRKFRPGEITVTPIPDAKGVSIRRESSRSVSLRPGQRTARRQVIDQTRQSVHGRRFPEFSLTWSVGRRACPAKLERQAVLGQQAATVAKIWAADVQLSQTLESLRMLADEVSRRLANYARELLIPPKPRQFPDIDVDAYVGESMRWPRRFAQEIREMCQWKCQWMTWDVASGVPAGRRCGRASSARCTYSIEENGFHGGRAESMITRQQPY